VALGFGVFGVGCASGEIDQKRSGGAGSDTAGEDSGTADDGGNDGTSEVLPGVARISVTVDAGRDPDDDPEGSDWMPADLEVRVDGELTHSGRAGIHVRGNSSRGYDKKSYALETWDGDDEDMDVSLLGLPEEEDWVLQGPYSDKTLIRNHLVYTLSRDIDRYAARTRFVELEVNGDYRGVYVFMEKIKRDANRVDLPSGAALIKRDWVEGGPEFIETESCGDELKVDWPSSTDGIVERLNTVEAALLGGDHAQVDLASFVDHMLLVELGRNVDGYVLSTWITLSEDDVLGMGPVWDYNGALGNADYFQAWRAEGWHYDNPEFPGDNPNGFCWYEALLAAPDFQALRRERWRAHRAGAWSDVAIAQRIDEAVAVIEPAVDRNFDRWPILGRYVWPNDEGTTDRESHADEIGYLKEWLVARAAWMDSQL